MLNDEGSVIVALNKILIWSAWQVRYLDSRNIKILHKHIYYNSVSDIFHDYTLFCNLCSFEKISHYSISHENAIFF